tara:strand:+ start:1723 stop:2214 length:492 start_codon:yes stop_codon:yes gene_type:complete
MSFHENQKIIIDVTPTLHGSEYASGDALFNHIEIPKAVKEAGGCSKLINVTVNSKKAAATGMTVILMQSAQSMESANTAMDITAVEGTAANFLGHVDFGSSSSFDMGNYIISMATGNTQTKTHTLPMLVQADNNSTSIYFTAVILGTVTYAASDLTFRFHIEY